MQNEDVLDHDGQKARADAMEREMQVMRLLGQTRHGDCRPAYRNLATGKLVFPVLSEREIGARA